MNNDFLFKAESYTIRGACFEVYKLMGPGFLEAVYQECLRQEFKSQQIPFTAQPRLHLTYKGKKLEQCYSPDFVCYETIIVEIKGVRRISSEHQAQLLNYLKATGLRLGFLANFGSHPHMQIERMARSA